MRQSQHVTRFRCLVACHRKMATHKVGSSLSKITKLCNNNHTLSSAFSGGFLICGRRLVNQGWFEFVAGAGNGPLIGVKGSRNLTNKVFCNGDFTLNFRKNGIIPGIVGSK